MIKQFLILSFLLTTFSLTAQNKDRIAEKVEEKVKHPIEYRGLELGFNVTTVLSRFVGNGPGVDAQDFPFLIRIHRDRFAFRIGLGANFKSDSFFDPTTFTNRNTEERVGVLKIGVERKIDFKKRLSFYYGLDAFAGVTQEKVTTSNFSNSSLNKDITRYGGGPLFGISYNINERVRLHTETNILGYFQSSTTSESINNEPIINVTTESARVTLEAPISLYINLKF